MSKFRVMINKDIELCDKLIENNYATNTDVQILVGKYSIDYPDFSNGLHNYVRTLGSEKNEIDNIKIIKSKLEYLLNRQYNAEIYSKNASKTININASSNNVNNVSNNISINLSVKEIEEQIKENTFLGEEEKVELLEKLKEIEQLQKSKESKTKKWNIAKNILKFIVDKGADIAIMYIPQILKAIQ